MILKIDKRTNVDTLIVLLIRGSIKLISALFNMPD